ncbi:hypothetical protein ABOM_007280 [Aspergillus bombycis]|uniref:Peptidase A1 domain-containing protein n=1 Tax=Aspergillus bombycis TaxID=109264 RepID=A0A1F7ZXG7_9EURO|nr:hypothetical protein ABOM_007280 [Aspergillus bombycis]OGM44107.1 hypothetical protein ABOM_007280 [Aspergillus bombycis]
MKSFAGIALLAGLPFCLAKTEPESEPASVDVDVDWYGNDGTWSAIEILNDTDTWIGLLGLGMGQSGHVDNLDLNVMETAYINDSFAPSGSYGYTAGAYYRLKGAPASLTIGGVDRARFYDNNATFHLNRNADPVVSLNTISISSGTEGGDGAHIDEHIIPFNLTYDESLGFYTYGNDTLHRERLFAMNISITLSISDLPDSSQGVNITLPFQAFDHSLTYPYPTLTSDTSLPYLPIRRANTNDEQRLGRVFFQEAYLAVDYERGQFSLYQAKFDADIVASHTDIVAIDSYMDKKLKDLLFGKPGLSAAAKAGIGVGTGTGAIIVIVEYCCFAGLEGYYGELR